MAEEGYLFQHLGCAGDHQQQPQQPQQAAIATRVMPIYRATFDGQLNLMEQQTYTYCNCCGTSQLAGCACNTATTSGQLSSTQPAAGGQQRPLGVIFQTQPQAPIFEFNDNSIQEPLASQADQQRTISSSGDGSLHCYTPLDSNQLAPLAQAQHYSSAGKIKPPPGADLNNNNNNHHLHHHQPFNGQTLFVQQPPTSNFDCAALTAAPVYHDFSSRPDVLLLPSKGHESLPTEQSLTNETRASSSSLSSRSSAADLTSIHNSLVSESSSSSFTSLNEINCNDLYRFQLTTPEELSQFELTAVSPRRDCQIGQVQQKSTLDNATNGVILPRDASRDQQHSRRGRPKKITKRLKNKINGKLWEFIRDLLLDEQTNPTFIRWERQEDGIFKFVQSDKVAKMWGERKQNPKMTYEKLSRAMRYYYKSKVLLPVFGRRLVYKFGPNATGWSANNPATR